MDNVIIIGVGGAGCNIADSCRKECPKLQNAKYIYVDKDAMAIVNHGSEDECILLTEDKEDIKRRSFVPASEGKSVQSYLLKFWNTPRQNRSRR